MKTLTKLTLTCVLALAPTSSVSVRAGEEPAAVVCFSSLDRVLDRLREVLGSVGTPQLVQQLDLVTQGVMQGGSSIPGIDKWRSFGAYVEEAAIDPHLVLFVPVSDSGQLKSFLSSLVALQPRGRDFYRIRGPVDAYLKFSGRWAFLSQQEADLDRRIPDPSRMIPQDARRYDVAVIYNIAAVPEAFKTSLEGARRVPLSRMPWETDAQFAGRSAARRVLERHVFPLLDRMTEELDHMTIGLNISGGDRIIIDSNLFARPGTSLSRLFSSLGKSRGRFDALASSDEALVLTWNLPLSRDMQTALNELVYELESSFPGGRGGANDGKARLAATFAQILKENIEATRFQGCLTVSISPAGKIAVGAGIVLKEASQLEKDFLAFIREDMKASAGEKFVSAEAEQQGQKIHGAYLSGPFPDPDLAKSFGKKMSVHFSFGQDSIVAALGGDIRSIPIVEKLIRIAQSRSTRSSHRGASPLYLSMRMLAWYSLGEMLHGGDRNGFSRIIRTAMAGRDRFTVRVEPLRDGLRLRCELQDGLLRMIAEVARQAFRNKMMGAGAGFSPR